MAMNWKMAAATSLLITSLISPSLRCAEKSPEVSDFIRFNERTSTSKSEHLETAIVRYEKSESQTTVDLVAVVHIGDRAYFQKLNGALKTYQTVFYEAVGSDFQKSKISGEPKKQKIAFSNRQQAVAYLGLQQQRNWIDYDAKNFVHADLSWKELYDLMAIRNQSITTTFQKMNKLSNKGGIGMGSATTERLTGGDPLELKRNMARAMSEGEKLAAQLESQGGTVIVTDRNSAVMVKLNAAINAPETAGSPKKFAIFYGAAHMPDFERRLLNDGFTRKAETWFTAWQVSEPERPEASAVSQFLKSLNSGKAEKVDATKFFGNEAKK